MKVHNNVLYNQAGHWDYQIENTYRRSYQASRLRKARLYKLHTWRLCDTIAKGTWAMFRWWNNLNSEICWCEATTAGENCQKLCVAQYRTWQIIQHCRAALPNCKLISKIDYFYLKYIILNVNKISFIRTFPNNLLLLEFIKFPNFLLPGTTPRCCHTTR